MKELCSKLIGLFLYADTTKQEREDIRPRLYESNRQMLVLCTGLVSVFMVIMFLLSFVFHGLKSSRAAYSICFASSAILFFLSSGPAKNKTGITFFGMYLFSAIVLSSGIALGTFIGPYEASVDFVVLMFAIPMLFTDIPLRTSLMVILSIIVYFIAAKNTQDAVMLGFNKSVVFPYGFLSIAVSTLLMRMKMRSLILQVDKSLLEEAAAVQEEQIKEISVLNSRLLQQNGIVASAGLGIWDILINENANPRMRPNEKLRELLGIEGMELSEEEIYSFWYERILPDSVESVNNSINKIISGSFDENTYQWNHPEKGAIFVRSGGTAKRLQDGTIVLSGYHSDVNDIVFREKQQQKDLENAMLEARKANEAKSAFLSRMSHDIRTPLNGIIGLIEQSDRHPNDMQLLLDGKEKARTASRHLLSLVNDVLELSKLDDENVTLAHEPFNIHELACDVMTIAGASAAEYGVTLLNEDCGTVFKYPYVCGSPLHVRQILLNIIGNAAKYNHPGGKIYCRAAMTDKTDTTVTYTVEIEDTGIGMSREFLKQIFEPFSQERSDARSTFKGTGLGMAIVKALVDRMNGTIAVESEVGKGSKFTVSIPFEIADEASMPKKADAGKTDITGIKILLAEDNELNMEIARSILEDFGAVITEAENGRQAVDIFKQNAPGTFDVIITDIMMPILDGYSTAREIRALDREDAKRIPIIAMTANAFEEDKQNALRAGMNGHIAKPIDVPTLIDTLAKLREKE